MGQSLEAYLEQQEREATYGEAYVEWCEEEDMDPRSQIAEQAYADYLVGRREAWVDEQAERGSWGRAY